MDVGPAVRRRQLSRQLKELRVAAGFATMDAAAAATGLSRATISRIEAAKQVILPRTVRLLCQVYGIGSPALDQLLRLASEAGEDRAWEQEYHGPEWLERYVSEESDATDIWTYQGELVPALLQTEDYARAVSPPEIAALTMDRQRRCATGVLHAVVNEAVLHRQVGGPRVLRAQLDHLREVDATVQVLPFDAGAHPAMSGSFTMLGFPAGTEVATVFVELVDDGLYRDRPGDFERYGRIFTALRDAALDQDASRAFIEDVQAARPLDGAVAAPHQ